MQMPLLKIELNNETFCFYKERCIDWADSESNSPDEAIDLKMQAENAHSWKTLMNTNVFALAIGIPTEKTDSYIMVLER